ncbi:hypothetical protein ACFSSC_09430 [Corynebacterium mendelii]|uniref:Secreted protein n=1 Tax=Corynebacterium mendelii TaxID=2765362 RepID=A0A939IUR0_9CORY|nr:hypothetical protein [Corynebacterium mendelii]MBN9645199.1 hypothetical protein [Corynebacterium mendelii]
MKLKKFAAAGATAVLLVTGSAGVAGAIDIYEAAKGPIEQQIDSMFPNKCEKGQIEKVLKDRFNAEATIEGLDFTAAVTLLENNKPIKAAFNNVLDEVITETTPVTPSIVDAGTRDRLYGLAIRKIAAKSVACGALTEKNEGDADKALKEFDRKSSQESEDTGITKILSSLFDGFSSSLSGNK